MSAQKNQSMSRLAHRNIEHAYTKAGMAHEFEAAHDQAQLSDRVKQNKWYSRWWRSFTKFFGGQHDQKINQRVFGKDINTKSPSEKRRAMKIQKIYGFIRLMTTLLDRTIITDNCSSYEFPTLIVRVFSSYVEIYNISSVEDAAIRFAWSGEIDFRRDRIPPFSDITNAKEYMTLDKAIVQDTYSSIIRFSKTFVARPKIRIPQRIHNALMRANLSSQIIKAELCDQDTISKTAFGNDIMTPQNRTRAIKIQILYKLIRVIINRLLEPKCSNKDHLVYELSNVVIKLYQESVQIINKSDISQQIVFKWSTAINLTTENNNIPTFSNITNAKKYLHDHTTSKTINDIYWAIIECLEASDVSTTLVR